MTTEALSRVHELLRLAKEIYFLPKPPKGLAGCKNCEAVDELARFLPLIPHNSPSSNKSRSAVK
jgi:hypothetical protein